MKLLQTINDNDFEPQGYFIRPVVRCIILDESETKVLFFGSHLVGGGVEEGETDEEAVAREAMEEVGMKLQIMKSLGEVIAYRDFIKKKYIVHGYLCKQVGELETPTTTDPEEQGMKTTWIEINTAIKKLENEIASLLNEYPVIIADEIQRKGHNRKTSLAFLKAL